jgi:hypothetical protein
LLHGIFIGLILLYQSIWFFFSEKTMASSNIYWGPYKELRVIEPGTILYHYQVNGIDYSGETTRNGIPITEQTIEIRYLTFSPSISRPDTYASNWLGFQIAWLIFFVITSMIFFIPNDTMPRNSYFYFTRRKPWIHMIIK